MTRCLSVLLLALGPVLPAAESLRQSRPNIIFIFSDDHAVPAISAYGDDRRLIQTRNLDRLAREGIRFDRCLIPNPLCGPSRASVLTGTYNHLNGFVNNSNKVFDGSQPTFPKLLRAAGYQTALIGKWHLGSDPTGFDFWQILPDQGEYYDPAMIRNGERIKLAGHVTDLVTDESLTWLKRRDRSKPFLLMSQHKAPHRRWEPAIRHLGADGDRAYPEPPTLFDDYAGRGSAVREQDMTIAASLTERDLKLVRPPGIPGELREAWDAYYEPRNAAYRAANPQGREQVRWKYQRYLHDYLACIRGIDESVGRILDYLEKEGLAENTIVVYSSDQGFFLGEHGWFDKRWIFEESVRAPLLVRWPGRVAGGGVRSQMVSNIDFAPTFLEAAGLPVPEHMQGSSLLPLLQSENVPGWRTSFYFQYFEYPAHHRVRAHYGVVTEGHKLVHYNGPGESYWELYDTRADPHELTSVFGREEHAAVQRTLMAELSRLRRELKVPEEIPADWFGPPHQFPGRIQPVNRP